MTSTFVRHRSIPVVKYVSVLNCFLDLVLSMALAMRFDRLEIAEREIIHLFRVMSRANVSHFTPSQPF